MPAYKKRKMMAKRRLPTAKRSNVRRPGGYAFTPPKDPPMSNTSQFKKIRLEIATPFATGTASHLLISTIVTSLRQATGLVTETAESLSLRLQRLMVYAAATPTTPIPSLTVAPVSPVPNINDITDIATTNPARYSYVANMKDTGTLNDPAKVGWVYSDTDKNYTFTANRDATKNFIAVTTQGIAEKITYIIDVEYSFNLGEVPPVDEVLINA